MPKVLITCIHLQRGFEKVRPQYEALGVTAVLPPVPGQQFDAASLRPLMADIDTIIAGDDFVDASVIDAGRASKLKAVIKWGVGTDSIDKPYAKSLGMPVFNTPGVFGEEVGDLALSHLLNLARQTHRMHESVVGGGWLKVSGRTLKGLTGGVVGLGSIGLAIARRLGGFGMKALGSDVMQLPPDVAAANGVTQLPLADMLRQSDVVFLACNLTPENRHMLNAATLATMKPGSYVINVARGPLIDEDALVDALASGQIAGAGLDVFEDEPLPIGAPIRQFADRCVFTSHNGSNTIQAVERINQMTTDIAFNVLGLKPNLAFQPNRVA